MVTGGGLTMILCVFIWLYCNPEDAVKIQIIFHSIDGYFYQMAEAVAQGARLVRGTEVALYQVPELAPDEFLNESGTRQSRQAFAHIPEAQVDKLAEADALIFGAPTRFGNMCASMCHFLDRTSDLWLTGALVGKVGSVIASTASLYSGEETAITSFHSLLLHMGMIVVGVPYSELRMLNMKGSPAGTPYGASILDVGDSSRMPSENELTIARFQGRYVAQIAAKIVGYADFINLTTEMQRYIEDWRIKRSTVGKKH